MKLLRLRLPSIIKSRGIFSEEKETSFTKLRNKNQAKTFRLIKIPKNIRAINCKDYCSNKEKSSNLDISNENNTSIKSLLLKSITMKHNLSPIIDLKKISSTSHLNEIHKFSPLNKKFIFYRRNQSKTNDMNNFLVKLDKIFGNKSRIKMVNNITKELIKENDDQTNGNTIYDNDEEERKNSITYFLDKNNVKKMIKTSLTKNVPIMKNILKIPPPKPLIDNFHIKTTKFTPLKARNIRKIKFVQNMMKKKLKNNLESIEKNNLNLSETKRDKYKFILKKKIKILGQEMNDNRNNMKSLDKQMESCIQRARDHIEKFAKIIENQYKNIYNLE